MDITEDDILLKVLDPDTGESKVIKLDPSTTCSSVLPSDDVLYMSPRYDPPPQGMDNLCLSQDDGQGNDPMLYIDFSDETDVQYFEVPEH